MLKISLYLMLCMLPVLSLKIEEAGAGEEKKMAALYDSYRASVIAGDVEKALSFRTEEVVKSKRWRFGVGKSDDKQKAQSLLMELPETYEVQHVIERKDGTSAELYALWHMPAQKEVGVQKSHTEVMISFKKEKGAWKMGDFLMLGDPAKIQRPKNYAYTPKDADREVETSVSGRIVKAEYKQDHTLILLRDMDREFAVFLPSKAELEQAGVDLGNYEPWKKREFNGSQHKKDKLKFFATGDSEVE